MIRSPRARPALALALVVGGGALALPAGATAATSACAPETGDWCTSVAKRKGERVLSLETFSFRGRVEICVTGPKRRTCRTARLRETRSGLFRAAVNAERFPDQGAGRYRVTFTPDVSGERLGPTLSFTVR